MGSASRRDDDRVFVKQGRRHYRRRYSYTELRIGLVVLVGLGLLVGWVAWRGAHPDPELFSTAESLLQTGDEIQVFESRPPAASTPAAASPVDRSPLPAGLAPDGWTEGTVSRFGFDNLYVKINGREDYYKTLGFQELVFVTLTDPDNESRLIDIECFDQGTAENALGAYAGERSPGIVPDVADGGLVHRDRNALFMTRGRYYVRAIGSEDSAPMHTALDHIRTVLVGGIEGDELPWSYALFVGGLGLDPGRIFYLAENAFSFGFGNEVHTALLDDESEIFVVRSGSVEEAEALQEQFTEGFRGYGSAVDSPDPVQWTEDRYIKTVSGVTRSGAWLLGVRGAPDLPSARSSLEQLRDAVSRMPQAEAP